MRFFKKKIEHALKNYFSRIIFFLCVFFYIFFTIRFFIVSPGKVNGRSMEPAYVDEDYFLINKYIYLFHPPRRYDVVQLLDKINGNMIIKRVIGLPGETIIIKRGKIYIQKDINSPEIVLNEKYLSLNIYTAVKGQNGAVKFFVGDNQYFVVGDNRENSADSRIYGSVGRERITGKVMQNIADLFR